MFSGIQLQGKCFRASTELRIFNKESEKIAVVYGRNGSGKSTISSALETLSLRDPNPADHEVSGTVQAVEELGDRTPPLLVEFLSEINSDTNDKNSTSANILVYNENYIDSRVKIEADGLGTVVLFGEQVDLKAEIDAKKIAINDLQQRVAEAEEKLVEAKEVERKANYALDRFLKADWANRARVIHNSPNATASWRKTREQLSKLAPAQGDLTSLITNLEKQISEYSSLSKSHSIHIDWPQNLILQVSSGVPSNLFNKSLVVPPGHGLQEKIADSLQRFEPQVHEAARIFSEPSVDHCPMCQHDISESYRDALLESIKFVLSEEANSLITELDRSKLIEISTDAFKVPPKFGDELVNAFHSAVKEYNFHTREWNQKCEEKKNNLYSPLSWNPQPLELAGEKVIEVIRRIEEAESSWNNAVLNRNKIRFQIAGANDRISKLQALPLFDAHESGKLNLASVQREIDDTQKKLSLTKNHLSGLLAQSANVQIAADEINSHMRTIFAEKERLKLELQSYKNGEETLYAIRNRSLPVRPEDLSIGERNILSLTYFFTQVKQRLEGLGNGEDLLVVLDDPISSVDVDNRLGIHSFLEIQMHQILRTDPQARLLILTHDLTAARDFHKSAESALRLECGTGGSNKGSCISYFLQPPSGTNERNPLLRKNYKNLNEYRTLLEITYEYAISEESITSKPTDLTIGNVVRRVLEAFSSFIYDANILDAVLTEEYSKKTGGRELAVDLRAGHRGFLHDSSHAQDKISSLRDYGGFSGLGVSEQINHVRRILALLYTLQSAHVLIYLPNSAKSNLDKWKEDLLES